MHWVFLTQGNFGKLHVLLCKNEVQGGYQGSVTNQSTVGLCIAKREAIPSSSSLPGKALTGLTNSLSPLHLISAAVLEPGHSTL